MTWIRFQRFVFGAALSETDNGDGSVTIDNTITDATIPTSDVTTNDASTTKHGWLRKLSNVATEFLDGTGAFDTVKDSDLSLSDITTNDVTTSRHGFVPKSPGDTAKFLRGGNPPTWEPVGGVTSVVATDAIWDAKGDLAGGTGADAASRLAVGADGTYLTADSSQATGLLWYLGPRLLFDSEVTGSDAATIDTGAGGVAGGYKVLEIWLYARTDETVVGSALDIRFNNDSGTNYDVQRITAANTTLNSAGSIALNQVRQNVSGASAAANVFGVIQLSIPNYAGTVGYKTGVLLGGFADTTAANDETNQRLFSYRSTSAITRVAVTVTTSGKKLKVGSRLTIFGR